jgi:hypothetical protein
VKLLQLHSYVPLPPVAVKVIAVPAQTVSALRDRVGAVGAACTTAVTVAALADRQVAPPLTTSCEYTDTDLVPVEALFTI